MKKKQILPLALVFCLFFLWAISSNLLPTMIRQLMKTCELNTFEASFTETAYWLAYFICPIPIAMFMKRYSYKAGIIFGLALAAMGGLLFFPAAMIKEYWAYLGIFFIIAAGMCFLETAANPYVTALGDASSAPRRLNLAQSFNGLGAFVAAMFLSKLVLSGNSYTRETLPAGFEGGWEGYIQMETDAMKLPYLILAGILIVIAIMFIIVKDSLILFIWFKWTSISIYINEFTIEINRGKLRSDKLPLLGIYKRRIRTSYFKWSLSWTRKKCDRIHTLAIIESVKSNRVNTTRNCDFLESPHPS